MSFAAIFTGFANGFVDGYDRGQNVAIKRDKRKRDRAHPDAVAAAEARVSATQDYYDEPEPAIPTQDAPLPPQRPAGFNMGGRVDEEELAPQPAVPVDAPPMQLQSAAPARRAPADDPYYSSEFGEPSHSEYWQRERSRMIPETLKWVEGVAASGPPVQADPSQSPLMRLFDVTGRSYPDLTQTIGGIRQVTKAPHNKPFTTENHLTFLEAYRQEAMQRGVPRDQIMAFQARYLDTVRHQSNRVFALATAAWDDGDLKAAKKFLDMGYGMIPDGFSSRSEFKGGKLHVQLVDEQTGKDHGKPMVMDRQQFTRAVGRTFGTTISFGNHLAEAESRRRGGGATGPGSRGGRQSAEKSEWIGSIPATNQRAFGTALGDDFKPAEVRAKADALYQNLPTGTTPAQAAALAKGLQPANGQPSALKLDSEGPQGPGIYDRASGELRSRVNPSIFKVAKPVAARPAASAQPAAAAAPTDPLAGATRRPGEAATPPREAISTNERAPSAMSAIAGALGSRPRPMPSDPASVRRANRIRTLEQRAAATKNPEARARIMDEINTLREEADR